MIAVIAAVCLAQKKAPWSAPVAGLVGRIEVERRGEKGGTPKLVPYLILKNVTNAIGTVDVWLSSRNLELMLVDSKGAKIENPSTGLNGRNGFVPNPFWLMIPFDSTVWINASLDGYFSREPGALLMETDFAMLFLPKGFKGAAYVTGVFTVADPPHEPRGMRWEGKLVLPKVKVWDGSRILISAG